MSVANSVSNYGWLCKKKKKKSEKTEKLIKPRKPEKNNRKNKIVKKNRLVWFGFGFISLKPKKPNPNRKKPSQNKKTKANRFETGFCPKNRTETGRFELVSVFFNFFLVWLFFL
jgi:hypothetical protein